MKQLFKLTGCLALAGLFASCQSAQQEANYQIIPMPQEIVTAQGSPFILKSSVKILYPEGNEKMQRNAKFLADYLKTATGKDFAIEAGTEGKNAIVLALGTENENPESYQMKVTGDGITITGPTEAGVFYGIQSLRKSLPVAVGADISMPAVEINDAPRFGYRGAHFDTSRHFFTVDEVKTYIDMMALHNMNRFHWHITEDQGWRLEIKKYPKLTEIGSKRTETVIGRWLLYPGTGERNSSLCCRTLYHSYSRNRSSGTHASCPCRLSRIGMYRWPVRSMETMGCIRRCALCRKRSSLEIPRRCVY